MLKKVTKNSVAAQVIDQLTDLIKNGSLQPGDRLPSERKMAEQLGVSRPPLRESLRALEYAGIIQTRYGDGVYVKSNDFPLEANPLFSRLLNQYTLEEMIEMRKVIETAVIGLAARRATDEDIETLQGIHDKSVKYINNMSKFIECDFAFHSAIAEIARNSMLFKSIETMRDMMGEFNRELLGSRTYRTDVTGHHAVICGALARRDAVAAVEAMDVHLGNVVNMALWQKAEAAHAGGSRAGALSRASSGHTIHQV